MNHPYTPQQLGTVTAVVYCVFVLVLTQCGLTIWQDTAIALAVWLLMPNIQLPAEHKKHEHKEAAHG